MSDELARRVARLGGAARRQHLLHAPGDARALDGALAEGLLVRRARGVYALPQATPEVVAAAVHGADVGCVSAVALAGVAVLSAPAHPHLVVPATRGRTASGLRDEVPATLHREAWMSDGRRRGVVVAPLTRSLARMLVCCSPSDAVVALDSALNLRLTTIDAVAVALPRSASVSNRVALSRADGRSRSPLETVARLALRAAGLRVQPGAMVPMVGEVDLIVEGRIVVELDGFAYHSGRREFDEDRRRDRELILQGYVVLRFTARDVLEDPGRLVATVCAALSTSPRRGLAVRI